MEYKECEALTQGQEFPTQEKVVSASRWNLEGRNMTSNSIALGGIKKYFLHDIHKLALDVTFTPIRANKGINKHGWRAVAAMYKEYM